MKVIDIADAKESLAAYAADLGEPVIVTRRGKPVAALLAVENMDLEAVSLATNDEFWRLPMAVMAAGMSRTCRQAPSLAPAGRPCLLSRVLFSRLRLVGNGGGLKCCKNNGSMSQLLGITSPKQISVGNDIPNTWVM